MSLTAEQVYFELGRLIAETPELDGSSNRAEINRWLSRAVALVQASGSVAEAIELMTAVEYLDGVLCPRKLETIAAMVHRALTRAEVRASGAAQGAVIPVGVTFDAYTAVRKVLGTVSGDILLVDPCAGAKALTDYALLAPDKAKVRLLADEADYEDSLTAAARRWVQQLGKFRSLMVRLAPAHTLHDRLILVDSATVWVMGQSFKDLARRRYTSLVRARPEAAERKVAMYAELWMEAQPL
jgi:hypothetical protein